MSCSSTPPFSPEWKRESQPSYARMPGIFLNKNLNKLQSPAGKTDSSTYPNEMLLKKASVSPIPFLNWIQTMTKVPSMEGNQGYLGKSDGKFSSFFQKGLHLLWRLLLAECQTQCQGTRVGLGELAVVQSRRGADNESLLSLLLSPSVNSLQKPPAAEASCKPSLFILKHPQSQVFQNQPFLLWK